MKQRSMLRAAMLTSVVPTAVLVALIFGAGAMLDGDNFLGIGLLMMLYFVVPMVFIATAIIAVFVRNAPAHRILAVGMSVALGLPVLITFAWLAVGTI